MTTCWTSAEVVHEPVPNLPANPSQERTSLQNGAKPEIIQFPQIDLSPKAIDINVPDVRETFPWF
jgi:hypothetical protein